ncbi:transposase [Fonticella tunisiensis]|uniref:Transposase n=1 Tax=Fonticella tunisiensis TaxID=1096341 RepID=A0A4R7KWR3_9CLOT|nr:transposase [Fonticella tunisiensis]
MARNQRKYAEEFKNTIVELYNFGKSLTELSSEYGISKSTINGWIKRSKPVNVDDGEVVTIKEFKAWYTDFKFAEYISSIKIIHSFSSKGNPYDNACIESFHAALKKEEVNLVTYYDFNAAKLAMFEYIESWYNRKRIHSSIGYITPRQCEDRARKSS